MITTWLEIGISNALVTTALAALAWVATRRMRPRLAFAVWLLVLAKLLAPPLWNAPLGTLRAIAPAEESLEIDWLRGSADRFTSPPDASQRLKFVAMELATPQIAELETPPSANPAPLWDLITPAIFLFWLLGAVVWTVLAVRRIRRFVVLLNGARRAPANLQAEVCAMAKQLGLRRVPDLRLTRRRVPPLVWALFGRPTILLPTRLMRGLSLPQRTALLMHELVHLRRRDHLVKLVELVVLALYWWLPSAWWARRQAEQAAEHCCDAEVVTRLPAAPHAYAEALVATIDYLSGTSQPLPLGASGFSQFSHVSRRIEMILEPLPARRAAWHSRLVLLVLALAVLPLSVRTLWAEPTGVPSTAATETAAAPPSETPPDSKADATAPESDHQPSPGGKFIEGQAGKDWQVELSREQVEQQMRDLVKSALDPVQAASKRREIARLELQNLSKDFDAGDVSIGQLLEAQRRLAEAEVSFARHATALCKDERQRKRLRLEANLLIAQEALDNSRRTWQKVYRLYRTGDPGGEANVEAQAREQFYQFKSRLETVREEYRQFTAAAAGDASSRIDSDRDAIAQPVWSRRSPFGRLVASFGDVFADNRRSPGVSASQTRPATTCAGYRPARRTRPCRPGTPA